MDLTSSWSIIKMETELDFLYC